MCTERKATGLFVLTSNGSGLSSETRHAQCIKPERVLSLYGPTIGTGL